MGREYSEELSRIYVEVGAGLESVPKNQCWVSRPDFLTRESGKPEGPTILRTCVSGNTAGPTILMTRESAY